MLENGKISVRQFTVLVLLYTLGTTILIIPSILASNAKQDTWIAGIIGVVAGILIVFLYYGLASRFPGKTFAEILELLLGKWLGKLVSILYFCTFVFLLCVFVLRDIGDFMVTVMLVETPIQAIHITFLLVVIFTVRHGLETFARAAELFLPWVIGLYMILLLTIAPQIDMKYAQPVLEYGFKPILHAGVSLFTFPFAEMIVFLMIIPYVNLQDRVRRGFITGITVGGVILILLSMISILVVGISETQESIYSSYDLAKQINLGGFFQRVEAMMGFIWFTTAFVKLTILMYVLCLGLAQTFELESYKILTLPLGLIMYVFSLNIFPNVAFLIEFTETMQLYVLIYGFIFPLLLLLISYWRRKKYYDLR